MNDRPNRSAANRARLLRYYSLLLLCSWLGTASAVAEEPWRIASAGRVVAVADIHGAHDAFVRILRQAELIDENQDWTGATTRLVIVGDVLDRGAASRQALDLIISLQAQARSRGGDVHFVLGNHEIMNLVGDLRYVSAAEFAAYAADEPPETRATAFAEFTEEHALQVDDLRTRAEFERQYPPGFFGHRHAYATNGRYGAWLLEQPLVLVIGETAFAHGGISQEFSSLGGETINQRLKQQLRDYLTAMESLFGAGVLTPMDDFYDHPELIERFEARVAAGEARWPDGAEAAVTRIEELTFAPVFALASPTWYRGMVSCSPLVAKDQWQEALTTLGVQRIVVGHTPTPRAEVLERMNGAILRIDTGMLASYYGGHAAALIIEGNDVAVIYADIDGPSQPRQQPRRTGARQVQLTDDELESVLAGAEIIDQTHTATHSRVTLRMGDVTIAAEYFPAARRAGQPRVAAYRLDRLLGLDMIPVTVARDLNGNAGALQFLPQNLMTETERSTTGVGGSAWCPLRDQYAAMYAFDALIFNAGRTPDLIAYDPESFQLILLGHESTFSTQRGRPRHLDGVTLELSDAWQEALARLDEATLTAALGDLLSRRQIRALLARRDRLIESATGP